MSRLPSSCPLFFNKDTEAFPVQPRKIISPACPGSVSSQIDVPATPQLEGVPEAFSSDVRNGFSQYGGAATAVWNYSWEAELCTPSQRDLHEHESDF